MNIEYELTKQDYIEFNIHHAKHSMTMKRALFIQRFIIPIIYLIMPLFIARDTGIPLYYWYIVFVIVSILWIFLYPKFFVGGLRGRIDKMLNEGKNNGILGKHALSVTEYGIIDTTQYGETKSFTIEKVEESKEYIFIYNTAISAYIIPKRIFTSTVDKNELIDIVNKLQKVTKGFEGKSSNL